MLSNKFKRVGLICLLTVFGFLPLSGTSGTLDHFLDVSPATLFLLFTAGTLNNYLSEVPVDINMSELSPLSARTEPQIIQFGGKFSRLRPSASRSVNSQLVPPIADVTSPSGNQAASGTGVAAGGNGRDDRDNNDDDRRRAVNDGEDKDILLCWHCQEHRGRWVYSCCGRRLCQRCHEGFGESPAKCPCCGINRKPRFLCRLCPEGRRQVDGDQLSLISHIYSEHLDNQVGAKARACCQHCNSVVEITGALGDLLAQYMEHCTVVCPFPECYEVIMVNGDRAQHFQRFHDGATACPIQGCRLNEIGRTPNSVHLQGHLQYCCSFCGETFPNQESLQTHFAQHIHYYSCSTCMVNLVFAGFGQLLSGMEEGDQQLQQAILASQMEFDNEQDVLEHIASAHCLVVCPVCNAQHQGANDQLMEVHIGQSCSGITEVVPCDGDVESDEEDTDDTEDELDNL